MRTGCIRRDLVCVRDAMLRTSAGQQSRNIGSMHDAERRAVENRRHRSDRWDHWKLRRNRQIANRGKGGFVQFSSVFRIIVYVSDAL